MSLRALLLAFALAVLHTSPAHAQYDGAPTGYDALRAHALRDPDFRLRRIGELRASIEELSQQRDAIDIGGPIALTVSGGAALVAGGGVALVIPIWWAFSSSTCGFHYGGCGGGQLPDSLLVGIGVGAVVALAGIVMLFVGVGERDRARAGRRPLIERITREREELEWLESISVVASDQAAYVLARAAF